MPTPTELGLPEVPAFAGVPAELAPRMYALMVRLRRFEKRAYDLFLRNLVKGTSHLSLGQEAVAAGFGLAMRDDDWTFATYRGHAHTLAKGADMTPVLAELLGRAGGLLAGKGGSMHLTSAEHNMMGSYAIVGAHLTVASGAAWSAKLRGTDQVAVCFFGDGTTNIGAFHEALNLAATWRLPVVFVCENNQWMEYTPIAEVTAVPRPAADRAAGYGLHPVIVDGNDVVACYDAATSALEKARTGGGPSLVEALTYRQGGHSRADPGTYRPDEEVRAWLARDPVETFRAHMLASGTDEGVLKRIEADADSEVDAATEAAEEAAPADPETVERDVWVDGSATWRN